MIGSAFFGMLRKHRKKESGLVPRFFCCFCFFFRGIESRPHTYVYALLKAAAKEEEEDAFDADVCAFVAVAATFFLDMLGRFL